LTAGSTAPDDVFINCPFDEEYAPTFEALIFAVYACGFRVRSARELSDASQSRIEKLYAIIAESRYGVHDLSRVELDTKHGYPRFNMPFELGVFLGAKRYGGEDQQAKRVLLLDVDPHRFKIFLSDMSGSDVDDHGGDPRRAVERLRDWLANVSRRKIPGSKLILELYDRFAADRPAIAAAAGHDPGNVP
jgi:hypothetical protein